MLTKTIELYEVKELGTEALDNAYMDWMGKTDYNWNSDNEGTLEAFSKLFDINVYNWSYDSFNFDYRYEFRDDSYKDLSYLRLLPYLNQFHNDLFKGKYYYKNGKSRYSKTIFNTDCVLSGYCMDYAILQPIYEFLKKPKQITLSQLLEECLDSFFKECCNDYDYYYSKDNFIEMSQSNEWYYRKNGQLEH